MEKHPGYNKHVSGSRKEAQTVIHNYSSIGFIACYVFSLKWKNVIRQLKKYIKQGNLNTTH